MLPADDGAVVLTVDADVAVISLNRPERLNAVNDQLVEGLLDALAEVEAGDCGAALLTGRGRAFCAGHDLKEPRGDDDGLRAASNTCRSHQANPRSVHPGDRRGARARSGCGRRIRAGM